MNTAGSIPLDWIKGYIDQLLKIPAIAPESALGKSAMLRAEHIADLVEAWRDSSLDHRQDDAAQSVKP